MKIKRRFKLILIILFAVILIVSLYFILNKKKEVISLSIGDYISMNKMNYFYNKTYDNVYSKDVICKEIKEPYLTSDKLLEKITNNEDNIQFYIKNANFININVATAAWYIFFCALVEEKSYTMRKRRGGLYKFIFNQ